MEIFIMNEMIDILIIALRSLRVKLYHIKA